MIDYVQMYESPRHKLEREEAESLKQRLETTAIFENGIARWTTNNHVIPEECAEFAAYLGMPIDLQKTAELRRKQAQAAVSQYRKNNRGRKSTAEEQFEMRAAFGPGQTVIDVISGKKYRT